MHFGEIDKLNPIDFNCKNSFTRQKYGIFGMVSSLQSKRPNCGPIGGVKINCSQLYSLAICE